MCSMVNQQLSPKLKGYVELIRPHNLVVAALTTLIGYVTVCAIIPCHGLYGYIYAALAVVFVAAGGYVINDYYDVGTDAVSKPWRPIPSGRVGPREAYALALVLLAAGILASAPLGPVAAVFVAVNAASVYAYSAYAKRTGFLGNIVVALNSAATILMGGLAACLTSTNTECPLVVLVPAIVAFLLVLGREIVKGIEDYYGDMKECYLTLAVRLGPLNAARIASFLLASVAAVSIVPLMLPQYSIYYMLFAGATDVLIIYSVVLLLRCRSIEEAIKASRRLRSVLKVAFLTGAIAFIVGVA